MATLTPTGASGTGTETLTFNLGANDSGSTRTYSFKLRQTGSSETADTLTITQATSGVDVTSVEVVPSAVTINRGTSYDYQLEANVYPSDASDKRVTWSSDDSSKVDVGNTGWIRGVALTSMSVGIKATSVADSTKYDYCYVTVVEAGSITVGSVNALKNQDSVAVPVTLYNIDTNRPITITVTSGTSWVTNIGSYDSSQHAVTIGISRNLTTDDRSTTVTVTGYDLAGEERTGSGTLSQNGVDDIDLISISVSGDTAINDDGTTYHRYVVTYNPSNTSETGVTWDVVDSQGNSVDGTLVDIYSPTTSTYCDIKVRSDADGDNVFVKATSTVRPSISATQAVTVTYASAIEGFDVNPRTVGTNIIRWDSTSDNTPVVTGDNIQPYISTIGGWSGFIEDADIVTSNGVTRVETTFSANSTTSSRSGQVIVSALIDGSVENITVNYTQAGTPDPSTFATIGVANLVVTSGARASITADVILSNTSNTSHTFSGEYYWTLYGYSSKENYDLGETGTVLIGDQVETGYTPTVAGHSSVTISLSHSSHLSFTGNYFKIHVSMQQHGEADAFAYLSEPTIKPVE